MATARRVRKKWKEDPCKRFDPFESVIRKGGCDTMDRMNRRVADLLRERLTTNRKRVEDDRTRETSQPEVVPGLPGTQETTTPLRPVSVFNAPSTSVPEMRRRTVFEDTFKPFQLWVRTVRKVRLMTVAYIALRISATDIGLASAEQTAPAADGSDATASASVKKTRMVNKAATGINLTFKPRDFKAVKETRISPAIVSVLMKNPDQRTTEDVAAIESLMIRMPSFEKYNRQMQLAMCRIVRYFKCEARRVILRRGHVAFSIYYIYSGSVRVIVDTGHVEADGSPKTYHVPLRKGACFGEVGVIRSKPRTATVVCSEDSEFLVIDREAYTENGLDLLQEKELATRFDFFRVWSPIVRWSDSAIRDLSLNSFTEEFPYNRLIVGNHNSKGDMLWFVLQGICDVMRIVDEDVWRATVSRAEEWNPWSRHYPRANQLPRDCTSGIPDILEDRKKASCEFQRERFAEKMVERLEFDHTGYVECVDESQSPTMWLSSVEDHHDERRPTVFRRERRPLYFIKVGVLVEGDCFGLENALPDARRYLETKDRLYLISRGSRIIRLSCSAFRDLVLLLGVKEKALRTAVKTYHENEEICRWLGEKIKWRYFKKDIVERTIVSVATNVKAANFLTHQLSEQPPLGVESPNYSKPFKMIWTGSTLVGPTKNPYHVVMATEALARGVKKLQPIKSAHPCAKKWAESN